MRVRLSSRGQLVIPSVVRRRHDFGPGTEFELVEEDDVLLLRPVRRRPYHVRLEEVVGCLREAAGESVRPEGMDRALRERFRRVWRKP